MPFGGCPGTVYLGSTTAITDEAGEVVTWMSYDAFGQRRDAGGWHPWAQPPGADLDAMLAITPRGFTGHEHIDHAGIIHMNGRIYDPHLGRFLQADPFVEDTGTLNRYTYVHNNPLVYTDPSGYLSVSDWVKIAAAVAITAVTGGMALAAMAKSYWGTAIGWAALGGAVAGGITTGTWEGAAWGAFTAVAFMSVGQWAGTWGEWSQGSLAGNLSASGLAAKSVSHGMVGGTLSRLQGGRFGHGFASAGVSAAASPSISDGFDGNHYSQAATAALVGGTTSHITGGKFANGAVTAAMAYAFNQIPSSQGTDSSGPLPEPIADTAALADSEEFKTLRTMVRRVNELIVDESINLPWLEKVTIDEIRLVESIPMVDGERVHGRATTRINQLTGERRASIRISMEAFESPENALKTIGWELKRTDPANLRLRYYSGRQDARIFSESVIQQYQNRWRLE